MPSAGMLRPSFPGGVPYPPRPGEAGHPSGGVRYAAVYPPGGAPGQPTQYTQRDGQVFVRQPPVSDIEEWNDSGHLDRIQTWHLDGDKEQMTELVLAVSSYQSIWLQSTSIH